ncbi:MAG TPA: hypothetical protein VGB19_16570 [Actinomycetota bacterium]
MTQDATAYVGPGRDFTVEISRNSTTGQAAVTASFAGYLIPM